MKTADDVAKIESELPVPESWRDVICAIGKLLAQGDYELLSAPPCVEKIPKELAVRIKKNVDDYGQHLAPLTEETWIRSVYQWEGSWWTTLIDLNTVEAGVSDLVMFLTVLETNDALSFQVDSVHVP